MTSTRIVADVDVSAYPPAQRLDVWRAAVEPLYDPWYSGERDSFAARIRVSCTGHYLAVDKAASAQRYSRNPVHAPRELSDYVAFQGYAGGSFTGDFDGRSVSGRAGDVHVIDLSRSIVQVTTEAADVNLLVPRARVEKYLSATPHGVLLNGSDALRALAYSHLSETVLNAPQLDDAESGAALDAFLTMVGGAAGEEPNARAKGFARASARAVAAGFIDRHLLDPALNATLIALRCGLSRASLFRAFEADGGIQAFITRERLLVALRRLRTEPAVPVQSIADACGFPDPSQFSRHFRQHFGFSPSEARRHLVAEGMGGDGSAVIGRRSWLEIGRLLSEAAR
ncbi:helix-turn-helix domain-containing protein [Mangrovibrevibacter kandeliae]|uniref:helix-turn-helix domain-containing protein n=1 Tax=Mangrovibrevibacter kandeliae TaxID=2968473 RepID=UPI002117FAD7|nr:helix-turn-helix domain-containing protein [Aurantimonas sp. MSK8Z-1]MCQ8781808.1 helix-turn-helix domain-containing protein [Aurantimonas sp. CSK15Z-1]MCW4115535.1 helix-turn-helix domain-containing protein [Aurantimonas sp. MSK8Z-1]